MKEIMMFCVVACSSKNYLMQLSRTEGNYVGPTLIWFQIYYFQRIEFLPLTCCHTWLEWLQTPCCKKRKYWKKSLRKINIILLYYDNTIFFTIWPFIVNAAVVVVVPVPKKELNTLQESEANHYRNNYVSYIYRNNYFTTYLVHTYAAQNFHHRLRGVL